MNKSATQSIVDLFGGIRPMARKLNIPVTTVQGWVKRDMIPLQRFDDIESFALHHNLGGQIVPLLNELKKADTSAAPIQQNNETAPQSAKQGAASFQQKSAPKEFRHGPADILADGNFIPRPLPEYTFKPQKSFQSAGAFIISIVSAVLATLIIVILFFAPDIIPESRSRNIAVEEQNRLMAEQLAQYRESVDTMADRLYGLAKTTQSLQTELSSLKSATPDNSGQNEVADAAKVQKLAEIEKTLSDLKESNNQLRTMVGQMEKTSAASSDAGALPEIRKMVEDVNNRLISMQKDIGVADAEETAAAENEAFDEALTVSETVTPDEKTMASLVQSAGGIADAFENGGEFSNELNIIATLLGDNSDIADLAGRLAPYSKSGIPHVNEIAKTLELLSGDIVAAGSDYKNLSVADKAKLKLDRYVSIRKNGELPQGDSSDAIVRRAQVYIEAGQIAAARAELAKLDGNAARVALPVTEKIEANQLAIAFIDRLQDSLKQYIPPEYMNGIIVPWLNATRNAAMLKFQDPRTIKAPVPAYLNDRRLNLHLQN